MMPDESDEPNGLSRPERCEQCKTWIETATGMDSYVEINDYDIDEYDRYTFCGWSCVGQWFEDGRSMGLIPGVSCGNDRSVDAGAIDR